MAVIVHILPPFHYPFYCMEIAHIVFLYFKKKADIIVEDTWRVFMKKKILLLLVVLVFISGCRRIPELADGGQAVVSFDREELAISADDLYRELVERFGLEILIDMIDRQILEHKFPDELDNAAESARNQLNGFKTWFMDEDGRFDEATMIRQIRDWYNVSTLEEFERWLELDFLRSLAIRDFAKAQITDRDIEYHYENVVEGDIEASHILIAVNAPTNPTAEQRREAEAAARAEALDLIRQLNEGADFAELAREHSTDRASAVDGGELGWITQGRMVEEFERAAWALELNRHSIEPVQSQFGFHIILKTGQREKPSLESVRDNIIETLALQLVQGDPTMTINALIDLRESYGFRIEDSRLRAEYSTFISNQLIQARGLEQ